MPISPKNFNITSNWTIVLIEHPLNSLSRFSGFKRILHESGEDNIAFIHINEECDAAMFIILDPKRNIRAVLYDSDPNSLDCHKVIQFTQLLICSPNVSSPFSSTPLPITYSDTTINDICPNINRIVGEYVLDNPKNVDASLLNFIVYAFALIQPDGSLIAYSKDHLKELTNLRLTNPNLKVIMAIGGWDEVFFSDTALTPDSRYQFAREVKKWVDEYNLDGIDIDWEYPTISFDRPTPPDYFNPDHKEARDEDKENFTLLLEALRDVLGDETWISISGIGADYYISGVEIDKIAPLIDYFNLMSYDFTAGSTGAEAEKHQSNLFPSDMSLGNISIDQYINNLIAAGMPPEKILVGLPFYGRRGAEPYTSFDDIIQNYLNKNGYKVKWDPIAKVPYILDPDGNFFLSYDNEMSIYFKGQYVIDNCLGGMFSWESNLDMNNILASAMATAVNNPTDFLK